MTGSGPKAESSGEPDRSAVPETASRRWPVGEPAVEGMIERGEVETVEPSARQAGLLMAQAEQHLASSGLLVETDPSSAFVLLYDAARTAMTAVLAKQGLRPGETRGDVALQE